MLFISEEKRAKGMDWAQRMLGNPHAVIIDTETTGLDGKAQAVQLAIIGIDGQTRYLNWGEFERGKECPWIHLWG